jgi:uncharacterized phage protein gp47/JayE
LFPLVIPAKAGTQAERSEDLRRRQSFIIIPCGASFCIRKNWAPRVRGVTILWNKRTTFVIPAKAGIQCERM